MSSSDANLIASWNNASTVFNGYISIVIYIIGIVGNFLNILVLSQRRIRSNPSAILFLISSIAGNIVIVAGLTNRITSNWTADLTASIDWICKLRNVLLYGARTIVLWTIVVATIDRWLSSNVNIYWRQMSTMKNVQRNMLIVLLYTCIINAPIIYCYDTDQTGTLLRCYGSSYACRLTTDLIYAFGTTLLPLLVMAIFSILIIKNVRLMKSRVQNTGIVLSHENTNTPQVIQMQIRRKKFDRQILIMLLIQVLLLLLFTSPHALQKVYTSFTIVPPTSSLQGAIQNCIFNIFSCLTFLASGMPFYIYTLFGGSTFRNAFIDLMKKCLSKLNKFNFE
jgi:hypothetical protein